MLEKIDTKEIMTIRAAMLKYPTKYFYMEVTETVDMGENDLGYVLYTADTEDELRQIPRSEFRNRRVGILFGVAAEPELQIGNVVYHA